MDIAINSGALAPNPSARPFDPAQWLARFVTMGGIYINTGQKVWVGGPPQIRELVAVLREVAGDDAKREALRAHILTITAQEAMPC